MVGWWIKKGLDLGPSTPNHAKFSLKILSMLISVIPMPTPIFSSKNTLQVWIYSKIYSALCANTPDDVTTFKVNSIWKFEYFKNRLWLFHEIKTILELRLRIYYIMTEITLNQFNSLTTNVAYHIETSQLICNANMMGNIVF